jgi:hypothetical protein
MFSIQALACDEARAFMKGGIAMAASKPMMATTIMISTSVKPLKGIFLCVFIVFCFRGGTKRQAGINMGSRIAGHDRLRQETANANPKTNSVAYA